MTGSRYITPFAYAPSPTGAPIPGALLNFYITGSSTRAPTYNDEDLDPGHENANPVEADASGIFPDIFLDPDIVYKVVLTYPVVVIGIDPVVVWTADPVVNDFSTNTDSSTYLPPFTDAVSQNLTSYLAQTVTVTDFGAVGNGVTDDYAAFALALSWAATYDNGCTVVVPFGNYFLSAGIMVPDKCILAGVGMIPSIPAGGSVMTFANSVLTCVTLASGNNETASIRDIVVGRTGGTPPASSTGVLSSQVQNIVIDNVFSFNHARNFSFISRNVSGITAGLYQCFSAQASEDHVYIDSWPELRIIGGRYGINGGIDYACQSYIHILGLDTSGSAGIGPNTLIVTSSQFNQGGISPDYGVFFDDVAVPLANAVVFIFDAAYFEGANIAWIKSNATSPHIQRAYFGAGTIFNAPSIPFFALDATTSIGQFEINGAKIYASTFDLTFNEDIGIVTIVGGEIGVPSATITGSSTHISSLVISGTTFNAGVTLAGKFGLLSVDTPTNVTVTATPFDGASYFSVHANALGLANSSNRPQYNSPGASVANPPVNGYWTVEFTDNTHLTFKGRGSDGTTRTYSMVLS